MQQEPQLVVVDASVVVKWQLNDEECISQASALRDDFYARGVIKAIAPNLLLYEVVNAILTAARRKRLPPARTLEAVNNLISLGVELRAVKASMMLQIAQEYNLAAYDAAYLALAQNEGCELWTGDRLFYQAVKDKIAVVKWIGDYSRSRS